MEYSPIEERLPQTDLPTLKYQVIFYKIDKDCKYYINGNLVDKTILIPQLVLVPRNTLVDLKVIVPSLIIFDQQSQSNREYQIIYEDSPSIDP